MFKYVQTYLDKSMHIKACSCSSKLDMSRHICRIISNCMRVSRHVCSIVSNHIRIFKTSLDMVVKLVKLVIARPFRELIQNQTCLDTFVELYQIASEFLRQA